MLIDLKSGCAKNFGLRGSRTVANGGSSSSSSGDSIALSRGMKKGVLFAISVCPHTHPPLHLPETLSTVAYDTITIVADIGGVYFTDGLTYI